MDLYRFFQVLWKHKWLMILGILTGVIITLLSLQRSYTTYQTSVKLILDEPGFALGKVGLGKGGATYERASTYSLMVTSDTVANEVKKTLDSVEGEVTALAIEGTPIIQIMVTGSNPKKIRMTAQTTADVFVSYIKSQQAANKIPPQDRVLLRTLGSASRPTLVSSRKWEIALLAFLAPLVAAAAGAFILENLKLALRQKELKLAIAQEMSEATKKKVGEDV